MKRTTTLLRLIENENEGSDEEREREREIESIDVFANSLMSCFSVTITIVSAKKFKISNFKKNEN